MKIMHRNLRQGVVKVVAENLDDLWYLSHVIEPEDRVKGRTERKVKLGGADDRKQKVVLKKLTLTLAVEKVEFHEHSNALRVNGTVLEGPEDVPHGSHHTISVEEGTQLTITKRQWMKLHLQKLEEAATVQHGQILIVIFDREEAIFILLKRRGHDLLTHLKGDVAKKDQEAQGKGNFYQVIVRQIQEYKERYGLKQVVIASPSFWKEYLMKEVPADLKKALIPTSCSQVHEKAITEILTRPELKALLESDKAAKETAMVEAFLAALAKDEACYGIDEVAEKVNAGNVRDLYVTDSYLQQTRKEQSYDRVDAVMKQAESMQATIHIISSDEPKGKIDGLGGIVGILRWKGS